MENQRFYPDALSDFAAKVLRELKVPAADAAVTAECLIKAHLRGFDTHGLPCLPGYAECLEQGRFNPQPDMIAQNLTAWSARLDADNGLGQVAAHQAMKLAIAAADTLGVGATVVRRSNHFGAASAYSLMALEKDCIGLVTSNASSVTAPFGAAEPILGTNPLSISVPAGKHPAFVIDMATSEGARKKIRKALEEGKTLPPGWALDKSGLPTTDPKDALEGVMLPFGGMKGSAITILLDIISGVLSGAEFGGQVLSIYTNQNRESGNGHFMAAFKIEAFMPIDTFKTRMDEELYRITSLRPAKGFSRVIYPGYQEHFTQTRRYEKGIPLDVKWVEKMHALGTRLGVAFPLPIESR